MPATRSQKLLLAQGALVSLSFAWLPLPVSSQSTSADRQCGEIAHRIACHSVPGACRKSESSDVFEKRNHLELMIFHICTDGPKDFSQYYWIDVNGAYRSYYIDREGNKTKFPPESPK